MKKRSAVRILLQLSLVLGMACFCCSCSTGKEKPKPKEEKPKKDRFAFVRHASGQYKQGSFETIDAELIRPGRSTTGELPAEKLAKMEKKVVQTPGAPKGSGRKFYEDFIALNGDEELSVSLVFNSAPLLDVLSAFGDILGFNFVADSDLKGVVTLNLNSKMTRRELWNTFDRMLFLAGAGVKVEDSLLRVMALRKLAAQPDLKPGSTSGANIYYRQLRNATAKEVVNQLKVFLGSGGSAVELSRPNAVLVCDSDENLPKLRELVELLDTNGKANWPRAVVSCVNVLPNKIATELQEVLPVLGLNVYKTTDRTELPGSVQLVGINRMRLMVISAATQEAVDTIKEWVALLDSAGSEDQEHVFVYKVRHNKAAQLARALSVIFETQGSALTIDASTGKQKIETINSPVTRTNRSNTGRTTTRSAQVNTGTNIETDQESKIFGNTVRVFADGVLNRLVIRSTPRTYASIKALLDRLDVIPAQVLLQVLVVEVTLTESTQFGLEFSGAGSVNGNKMLFGTNYPTSGSVQGMNPFYTNTETGVTSIATGANRQAGGTFAIYNPSNPEQKFGYIRALAGNNLVKVISSPQLLVSSHTEAKMQVGQSVPVLKSGITNTASEGSVNQTYEYRDIGVILTVIPQITSADYIALEVKQELSDTTTTSSTTSSSSSINSPTFSVRTVQTEMTIANGETTIIGGMIQEKKADDLSSLPLIKDIPFLGRLLGSTNAAVERSEVLVLITGNIINERSKVEDMLKRYNDAIKAINYFEDRMGDKPGAAKQPKSMFETMEFWM